MARIILKKERIIKELKEEDSANINSGCWKSFDPISEVNHNVMYYAFDVKKVLDQAKEGKGIPVFLEVNVGKSIATVLALKKLNAKKGESEYYRYAASGWPPHYETVRSIFGPNNIIDFRNDIPMRIPEEEGEEKV